MKYGGMKFVRVRSYLQSGELAAEQLYLGENQYEALERFRRDYPEHQNCVLVAETVDGDDPKNEEYIRVCIGCTW